MRRGAKPGKAKVKARPPVARKSPKTEASGHRELEKRLAESLEREKTTGELLQEKDRALAEALEQQTATAEILRVISLSGTDAQPVFDAIAESALRLLRGSGAMVVRVDGGLLHLAAICGGVPGSDQTLRERFPLPVGRAVFSGAAVLDREVKQIADIEAEERWAELRRNARVRGWRAAIAVPMLQDGQSIGAINVTRSEPGTFTGQEVALLKTFADQAVIALENVRLFKELEEKNRALTAAHAQVTDTLEQQTATSEILQVISQSPTEVQPVFETIVRNAVQLCGGVHGGVYRFDGQLVHSVAHHGYTPEELASWRKTWPRPVTAASASCQAIRTKNLVRIADIEAAPELSHLSPEARANLRARGSRSVVAVPMRRQDDVIGAIGVTHGQVDGFSDAHVELLKTFADQAVIAIENARLFTELQASNRELTTALDQQTATGDILRVISQSQTDVQPVFDAIVASAIRLLRAYSGALTRIVGDQIELAALTRSGDDAADAALRAFFPRSIQSEGTHARAIRDRAPLNIADAYTDPRMPETVHAYARALGYQSQVVVPMLRHDEAVGTIAVTRREPGGFTDDEIALLQTFADQAVIAIENVRLFTELQASNRELTTALDQQTATSDILRVISRSQTDVQPVFDAIVASAVRLLGVYAGALTRLASDQIELAAFTSTDEAGDAALRAIYPQSLHSERLHAQVIRARAPLNISDTQTDPRVPEAVRATARGRGYRSLVVVPLLRHDEAVGTIAVSRREPGGFTDDEIALLKTFADQAVIAIENVRLFTELEGRNRDLTATSEILRVISSSPTDVQPVFDTIVRSAVTLCDGLFSGLYQFDGELIHFAAQHNFTPEALEEVHRIFPLRPTRALGSGRAILERAIVHMPDIEADPEHEHRALTHAIGQRSGLWVPMLREGAPIGVIVVGRAEPGAFSDSEIELLKTFADQAVIAIENVRLFTELQASNRELTTALDQQTATSDILRVISRSQTDVQPVFDAIVASAVRLLGAYSGALTRLAGDQIELAALTSTDEASDAALRTFFPHSLHSERAHAQAMRNRAPFNIADAQTDPRLPEAAHASARVRDYRSIVLVPLLRHDEAVGTISVTRREPGGFTDDEIALLQTFADQAVIAIENVRLFTELEGRNRDLTEALEQQTATAEILRVISRSQTDVQPVFDTIVRSAVRLCDGLFSALFQFDGELIHQVAQHNYTPEALEEVRRLYPARPTRGLGTGRAILERAVVHIPDVQVDPEVQYPALPRVVGFRSGLFVPMLREGAPIGVIMVARAEPGPFSDNEIELLKTFADQAVIAIENVRLFKELEARTGELTQSVEKLTALGEVSRAVSSTLDVETVLDTIVSRASQLAGAAGCAIFEYDVSAEQFELRATHNYDAEFVEALRAAPLRKGEGLMGRAAEMREPIQIPDITQPGAYQSSVRDTLIRFGYRALLAVPLLREDQIIGSLSFNRKAPGEFPPEVIDVLKTFATQSALAIQNARLFREIADKSAQLEAASRHKSEFLANMSHELRTPLNAIIGFSEVLVDRMFGELNEKQDEYLKDIYASGQHLLSLINDILDLSKIEAGRMELEATDFDLPSAIDNALTLVRERATRRGITLGRTIDEHLKMLRGDERKVKQVLLNLLSNALKFTPEGGRIDVSARLQDGAAEIAVADTGVGIAPEDQEAVFEEFRQVGTADKKVEGTGLGLALSRKFIELHGGRIWVKSQVGHGSTFTFTLPVHCEE
jgi:GAF domain-containing protein